MRLGQFLVEAEPFPDTGLFGRVSSLKYDFHPELVVSDWLENF